MNVEIKIIVKFQRSPLHWKRHPQECHYVQDVLYIFIIIYKTVMAFYLLFCLHWNWIYIYTYVYNFSGLIYMIEIFFFIYTDKFEHVIFSNFFYYFSVSVHIDSFSHPTTWKFVDFFIFSKIEVAAHGSFMSLFVFSSFILFFLFFFPSSLYLPNLT